MRGEEQAETSLKKPSIGKKKYHSMYGQLWSATDCVMHSNASRQTEARPAATE
jgi:hypothetical protein